ncbi:MAG: hypothetical protein WD354_11005 [Acidimicrobiia bacterium]
MIQLTFRSTPLLGLLPAGAVALGLAIVASGQPTDAAARFVPTRLALLVVVVGISFAFDDAASRLTDSAPRTLRLRRAIRAGLAVLGGIAVIVPVLLLASSGMDLVWVMPVSEPLLAESPLPFPWGRLALEILTMGTVALAAAAVLARRGEEEPGRIVTGVVLATYAVTFMIPQPYRPWAYPSELGWLTKAPWWWVVTIVLLVVTAALSWDARGGRILPRPGPQ